MSILTSRVQALNPFGSIKWKGQVCNALDVPLFTVQGVTGAETAGTGTAGRFGIVLWFFSASGEVST